ncbi:Hypothetical protein FKW44_016831, partial [Caligus rogercresseyi]
NNDYDENDSSSAASNNCSSHKNNTTPSQKEPPKCIRIALRWGNATQGNSSASPSGNSTENASAPQTTPQTMQLVTQTTPQGLLMQLVTQTTPQGLLMQQDQRKRGCTNQSVVLDNVNPPNNIIKMTVFNPLRLMEAYLLRKLMIHGQA